MNGYFLEVLIYQAKQPLSTNPEMDTFGSDYTDGICDGQTFLARELCDLAGIDWRNDEST